MRIAVGEQAYASAVEALVGGNGLAAEVATVLSGRLASSAGMAGDDATATVFADAYDDAATASVAALESVVGAFAALARLVEASVANHARAEAEAEAAAVLPGWAAPLVGPPTLASGTVGVILPEPPSALGAAEPGPGGLHGLVFGLLQEVFWPNAETGRVRAAAATWATAAQGLDLLTTHCDCATWAVADERSPEVPLVLEVIEELRTRVGDLRAQFDDLAAACTDYADAVDTRRHELLELLEDLATEFAVGAVFAGGLSLLSGGTAVVAGGGAGATRIATASAKFRSILDALRATTAATALQARPVALTAGEIGTYTRKISRARAMLMDTGGAKVSRGPSLVSGLRPGWLRAHESAVAHTVREHVARTVPEMRQRLLDKPGLKATSTFRSDSEAERAIEEVLRRNTDSIRHWLADGRGKHVLTEDLGRDVGEMLQRGSDTIVEVSKTRVVLIPDATMPQGWRLLTAYPCK